MENVRLKSFTTYEEDGLYFAHIVYKGDLYEKSRMNMTAGERSLVDD